MEKHYVECNRPTLTILPIIRFTGVRNLRLSDHTIKIFERDCFVSRGLTELESLDVSWIGLRTIEVGAFNGLTDLKSISIFFNNIDKIIRGTFENLSNLKRLDLVNNNLQHLDSDVFSGLFNLNHVSLAQNRLLYLNADTFLGLPNIQSVDLSYNPFLKIPTDRPFIKSPSLLLVSIGGCNLRSVSSEIFAKVSALEKLDLSDNKLSTIDINILKTLPKLSLLYLHGNPLHCDCQLKELWRWCEDRNITSGYFNFRPHCATPSEVKGMTWDVLEKEYCLQVNISYNADYKIRSYNYTGIDENYTGTEMDTDLDTEDRDTAREKGTDTTTKTDTDKDPDNNGYEFVSRFLTQYQAAIYAVPFTLGTTGNVIIIIIIIFNKDMRTIPNMYILNLAISDIIYLTVLFSEACANTQSDTWIRGDFMCTFIPFCRRLSVGLSAYFVAVLSIQRYRVTVNPLDFHISSQPTWKGTVATICGVWIVAALFAVPSALSRIVCEEFTFVKHVIYYRRVVIFELIISCVFPLFVIAFSYIMTARHLLESSLSIFEDTKIPQQNTRRNTAKIVLGLTIVFLISYVPYHTFWAYVICTRRASIFSEKSTKFFINSDYKLQYSYQFSSFFLLINSCLNPVALFLTSSPFRQHLKRYLTCVCKTNSPPTDLELARRN
jgi:hypothetical protein